MYAHTPVTNMHASLIPISILSPFKLEVHVNDKGLDSVDSILCFFSKCVSLIIPFSVFITGSLTLSLNN